MHIIDFTTPFMKKKKYLVDSMNALLSSPILILRYKIALRNIYEYILSLFTDDIVRWSCDHRLRKTGPKKSCLQLCVCD